REMSPAARWLCKVGQASRLTHLTWENTRTTHSLADIRLIPGSLLESVVAPLAGQARRLTYVEANSCHNSALMRIPFANASRLNFSFGECGLSSGKARPSISASTPRIFLKSEMIGIEPPSRSRTGSQPKADLSARNAAWASGPVGGTRYGSPPWPPSMAMRTVGGQRRFRCFATSLWVRCGVWFGTRRKVSFALAQAGMMVLLP